MSWPFTAWVSLLLIGPGGAASDYRDVLSTRLKDFEGKSIVVGSDAPLTVIIFLGTECPAARLYAGRLSLLAEKYPWDRVRFVAVDSNIQDSLAEMAEYAKTCGLKLPFLKDPGAILADRLEAERTPEVFVVSRQGKIQYRGRIDDQWGTSAGIGYRRVGPQKHDLALALDDLLAGRSAATARTPANGCRIGRRPASKPNPTVTWSNQICRLVQKHCVECHRPGEVAPFSMVDYEEVVGWSATMGEAIAEDRMPPWHADPRHGRFSNDCRLSGAEKKLFAQWIADGAPEGDPKQTPPARSFVEGWQIGRPDEVFWMSDQPFVVPADGKVQYQYLTVDPGYREGRWIKAVECRPGAASVVHHINVFIALPEFGQSPTRDQLTDYLIGAYAPGLRTTRLPEGSAFYVPPGAKFVFQMHYSSVGVDQPDRSSMGVVYAKPEDVREKVEVLLAVNNRFEIPPYAKDSVVESMIEISKDASLFALSPHMHLRGRSFRYEAHYPNGASEILLDIPRFDFNWQTIYSLEKPKLLPRGTVVACRAVFDNSSENVFNPDPSSAVRWGDQTFEEMMIGYLFVVGPKTSEKESAHIPTSGGGVAMGTAAIVAAVGLSLAGTVFVWRLVRAA